MNSKEYRLQGVANVAIRQIENAIQKEYGSQVVIRPEKLEQIREILVIEIRNALFSGDVK